MPESIRQCDEDGSHRCELFECKNTVPYDDEPYCFDHSPNSGGMFVGYSYAKDTFNKGK